MSELQCDDLYVPALLLKSPSNDHCSGEYAEEVEDFLKNNECWTEYYPSDDLVDKD
jgi:hypothetical protein